MSERNKLRSALIRATGAEIRRLRQERGWTLKDLATAAGFTLGHLSEVETARTEPSISCLEIIAAALGRRLSVSFIDRPEADYEGGAVG